MKCFNCLKKVSKTSYLKLNKHLNHINKWCICDNCDVEIRGMYREKVNKYY